MGEIVSRQCLPPEHPAFTGPSGGLVTAGRLTAHPCAAAKASIGVDRLRHSKDMREFVAASDLFLERQQAAAEGRRRGGGGATRPSISPSPW